MKVCASIRCEAVTISRIATAIDTTAALKFTPPIHLRCCKQYVMVNLPSDELSVLKLLMRNFRFSSPRPLTIYPFRDSNAQIFSLAEPRARNRVQTMRMRAPNCWSRPSHLVLSDTPPSPLGSGSISRLPRPRLSRRKRQPRDSPEHTAKQPPRQMALRQQEPVVAGMFHQPSSGLHQPLLQAGQRPVLDSLGQRQPPPQIAQVVSQHTQPQPYPVVFFTIRHCRTIEVR